MNARGVTCLTLVLAVALVTIGSSGATARAGGGVEERIAVFWDRVNALKSSDFISSADLGQWALNVIERDSRTRLSLADFRDATARMQEAFERAGPAPDASATAAEGVEQRIASFWTRINGLWPTDHVSSADLGQWALNVTDRDKRTRLTVADFRSAAASMQLAFERAGPARIGSPVPTPTPTRTASPTLAPPAVAPVLIPIGGYPNVRVSLWLRARIDSARFLELSDGSIWEVNRFDRFTTRFWTRLDDVIVTEPRYSFLLNEYSITNLSTRETVSATYERVTRHIIADLSDDESVVVLDDGTVWEIDPFDSFETFLWGYFDEVVLIHEGIFSYRMVNLTQRTAAGVTQVR